MADTRLPGIEGKTLLLFGGAQGIGAGIAELFAAAGAKVALADRDGQAADETAAQLGAPHIGLTADVSRKLDCEMAVCGAEEAFGSVDILIQNAGIYPWTLIENISVEEWDQVLSVNLRGCLLSAQSCLPRMKAQEQGRIIFTSSITGPHVTSPGHGHYSASKAGINGFIRAAALEFAAHGITVNGVEPGNILTEGVKEQRSAEFIETMAGSIPLGRLGTPQDVAHACLFLASDLASYVTGTTIVVDGGQLLPEGGNMSIDPPDEADQ